MSGNRQAQVENISSSDKTVIVLLLKLPRNVAYSSMMMKMRSYVMIRGVVIIAVTAGGRQVRLSA